MGTRDWRTQLPSDLRQTTINRIFETLKDQFPFTGESIEVVQRSATQFEEYIFYSAENQEEYILRTTLSPLPELQIEDASSFSSNIPPVELDNSNPVPLDEEPAKNWRDQLSRDLRLQNIETLVDNMRLYPAPNTRRPNIDELMTMAINWEQSSFYAAINEDDYFDKFADKITEITNRKR